MENDEKIVFEDYGIEFTDKDFEGVDQDTLIRCKRKLNELAHYLTASFIF